MRLLQVPPHNLAAAVPNLQRGREAENMSGIRQRSFAAQFHALHRSFSLSRPIMKRARAIRRAGGDHLIAAGDADLRAGSGKLDRTISGFSA
jgi:hypothetical protein